MPRKVKAAAVTASSSADAPLLADAADYLGVPISPVEGGGGGSTVAAGSHHQRAASVSPLPALTVKVPAGTPPKGALGNEEDVDADTPPTLFTPIITPAAAAPSAAIAAAVGNAAPRANVNAMAHGQAAAVGQGPFRGAPLPARGSAAPPLKSVLKQPSMSNVAAAPAAAVTGNGSGGERRNSSFQSALADDAAAGATTTTFFHACTDYRPLLAKRSEYFMPDLDDTQQQSVPAAAGHGSVSAAAPLVRPRSDSLAPPVVRDVISVVVPCFTESGRSLQKTLYDLWIMQRFMHRNRTFFHFHICIILDGWSKAPPSLQAYIRALFQSEEEAEHVKFSTLQKEVAAEADKEHYPDVQEERIKQPPPMPSATTAKSATTSIAHRPAAARTSNGDSSSEVSSDSDDSEDDDDDDDDEEAPASERKKDSVKPLLRPRVPGNMNGFACGSGAGGGGGGVSTTPSSSSSSSASGPFKSSYPSLTSPAADSSTFLFPESASFSGFAHPDARVQSKTNSWERYISNWSADSDLNPPTNPETLIVQKWISSNSPHSLEGGAAVNNNNSGDASSSVCRSIKAIALFPGLEVPAQGVGNPRRERRMSRSEIAAEREELLRKKSAALKMTVIIKRDNRRKHNSHEWFLTAFAPVYTTRLRASSTSATGVQLCFMTDAGTRFHESCVLSLVQHALQSPTTVACSGRQRVMTHRMQNEGEPPVDKLSFNFLRGQLYRCAQGFEYEASISAFNGAFDWTGMLPVLPGPCGLFRLDIILREGDAVTMALAVQQERVRGQVGKLRAIHQAASKALLELHSYVWSSLTVTKQMHRATWTAYTKRQLSAQSIIGRSNDNTILEPFTPYERAASAFEYVELRTQLFALTNELQRHQLLLFTVLLRLDAASVCLHSLPQMLSSESLYWTRMQALLVLVRQLHALESANASATPSDWDRQMHIQLQQLRRLLAAQIFSLKEFLQRIEVADGGLLADVKAELALDPEEQDHLLEIRSRRELSSARDPVEFYLTLVNQVPSEVDLITANLMLAEDRILSYAVVLMAHEPVHTDFVPDALFFFEAETEAENALQQSRRWTNGTVAGFVFLLLNRMDSNGLKFRQSRFLVYLLVAAQLIMYCIVGVSPALWTIGLHYSLNIWFGDAPQKYGDWIVFFYLLLYALFVVMHADPSPGKKRLHVWLFHFLTVLNMLVATMPIAALVPNFLDGCRDEKQDDGWPRVAGLSLQCWILGSCVVGTIIMPFLLAILYDIYSLLPACNKRPVSRRLRNCPYGLSFVWRGWGSVTWEMLTSCIWFYLFLPTKVSLYPCYAFSRTWELTWGNKPSDSLHSITTSKTSRQLESTKKQMLQLSQVISYSLLLANILLFLTVSVLGVKSGVLVSLTAFILLWALVQMGLSLLWILYRLFVAPLFKGMRIVAEWLDLFSQNETRPVPGGLQAQQAGEQRRRDSKAAAAAAAAQPTGTATRTPLSQQPSQRGNGNGNGNAYGNGNGNGRPLPNGSAAYPQSNGNAAASAGVAAAASASASPGKPSPPPPSAADPIAMSRQSDASAAEPPLAANNNFSSKAPLLRGTASDYQALA